LKQPPGGIFAVSVTVIYSSYKRKQRRKQMKKNILITTFATWEPHQLSNASDDLVQYFIDAKCDMCHYFRHLPVDFTLAPSLVVEAFETLRPRVLVCCGMAEDRDRLSVESQAVRGGKVYRTEIDLEELTAGLPNTYISHDAGDFVCNALYYSALEHLDTLDGNHHCLFVHVPVLTDANVHGITEDFKKLIARLAALF